MTTNARTQGADTARRALQILEVVSRANQAISLDAITEKTGLSKSMAYRLVRALQEEGYVERTSSGGYAGGSQLLALASSALPNFDEYTNFLPLLRQVATEAGETCTLHRRAGHRAVLLLGAESEHQLRWVWAAGELTPLARGSAGVAILSGLSETETNHALDDLEPEAAEQARRDVARARRRGYALSFGANHPGLHGVAAPVPGAPMAISVSGPSERWTEQIMVKFAPRLLELIRDFAATLGT